MAPCGCGDSPRALSPPWGRGEGAARIPPSFDPAQGTFGLSLPGTEVGVALVASATRPGALVALTLPYRAMRVPSQGQAVLEGAERCPPLPRLGYSQLSSAHRVPAAMGIPLQWEQPGCSMCWGQGTPTAKRMMEAPSFGVLLAFIPSGYQGFGEDNDQTVQGF